MTMTTCPHTIRPIDVGTDDRCTLDEGHEGPHIGDRYHWNAS